jgi:hypothetical protein
MSLGEIYLIVFVVPTVFVRHAGHSVIGIECGAATFPRQLHSSHRGA